MISWLYPIVICNNLLLLVSAHGYLSQPAAIYKNDLKIKTSYAATVDGNSVFGGLKWNDSPDKNSDQLAKKIYDGSMPELKTFFANYVVGCPSNDLNSMISVDTLSSFKWQNDEEHKGFIPSHEGPCEVWIDSTKVFTDTNCARKYTSYPAEIAISYSTCSGTCQFEFYWLALHEPMWQLYKACAIITNNQAPTIRSTTNVSCYSPTPSSTPCPVKKEFC